MHYPMTHPKARRSRWSVCRWNPALKRWEFWLAGWRRSYALMGWPRTFDIGPRRILLQWEDTWCEPMY